jgi:hypothetical protein
MTDEQADSLLQANDWCKWSDARWLLQEAARIGAKDAAAELRRLHAEVEELRADAERYRWLRDQTTDDGIAIVMKNKHIDDSVSYPDNINGYIDAARRDHDL